MEKVSGLARIRRLQVDLETGEGASLLVTGQAAEKVYRSSGPIAEATTTLSAGPDSRIEFLPQGTIVYDGARFRRITTIEVSPGSRVMAGEVLSLGRVERGERLPAGCCTMSGGFASMVGLSGPMRCISHTTTWLAPTAEITT